MFYKKTSVRGNLRGAMLVRGHIIRGLFFVGHLTEGHLDQGFCRRIGQNRRVTRDNGIVKYRIRYYFRSIYINVYLYEKTTKTTFTPEYFIFSEQGVK